jgi:hypothetical protein
MPAIDRTNATMDWARERRDGDHDLPLHPLPVASAGETVLLCISGGKGLLDLAVNLLQRRLTLACHSLPAFLNLGLKSKPAIVMMNTTIEKTRERLVKAMSLRCFAEASLLLCEASWVSLARRMKVMIRMPSSQLKMTLCTALKILHGAGQSGQSEFMSVIVLHMQIHDDISSHK